MIAKTATTRTAKIRITASTALEAREPRAHLSMLVSQLPIRLGKPLDTFGQPPGPQQGRERDQGRQRGNCLEKPV